MRISDWSSDVCSSDLWVNSDFQNELRAISKGSHGRRVKRLFITQRTVKVLQQYVNEQRVILDPHGRSISDFSKPPLKTLESAPLFLTRLGTADRKSTRLNSSH